MGIKNLDLLPSKTKKAPTLLRASVYETLTGQTPKASLLGLSTSWKV